MQHTDTASLALDVIKGKTEYLFPIMAVCQKGTMPIKAGDRTIKMQNSSANKSSQYNSGMLRSRDHFFGLGLGLTVIGLGLGLGLMR